jgi:hypothetical protein
MESSTQPDLFPELRIMEEREAEELEYRRQGSASWSILASPETAEIFFNDRLIGRGPQTIRVNPYAEKNVLSITAPEHLEAYIDLSTRPSSPTAWRVATRRPGRRPRLDRPPWAVATCRAALPGRGPGRRR